MRRKLSAKILFLTTEAFSFWSHRLTLARAVKKAGADVVIMARLGEYRRLLEKEGFKVIPWDISRRSLNPIRELHSLLQVIRTYWIERPDLVHHVAIKPTLYGGIAAQLNGVPAVSTLTGLGSVFTNSTPTALVLRFGLSVGLRFVLRDANCRVIFQNDDDRNLFLNRKIVHQQQTMVLPGFGVDTQRFTPAPEPTGTPVVILPARMLWEKGVADFVAAAAELKKRCMAVRMVLVGAPDLENPGCIPEEQLREWARSGVVEWAGHERDMVSVLRSSNVVCLPSYREGFPKVLLEAASCGRAIVTTLRPGCAHAVRHRENGLLVPAHNPDALANAIATLLHNDRLRMQLGVAGRARAVREFSDERIAQQTLDVYEQVLHGKRRNSDRDSSAKKLSSAKSRSVLNLNPDHRSLLGD